jgi:hypothetical protein
VISVDGNPVSGRIRFPVPHSSEVHHASRSDIFVFIHSDIGHTYYIFYYPHPSNPFYRVEYQANSCCEETQSYIFSREESNAKYGDHRTFTLTTHRVDYSSAKEARLQEKGNHQWCRNRAPIKEGKEHGQPESRGLFLPVVITQLRRATLVSYALQLLL